MTEQPNDTPVDQEQAADNTDDAPWERRYTPGVVELRSGHDGRQIGGYALKFDRPSENLGGFVEMIAPCFPNKSRADGWPGVVCRYNHKDDFLLGSAQSGTLKLTVDDNGLIYDVDVPQCRNDVLEMVSRRDVQHSSFAFEVTEEEWGTSEQGYPLRKLVSGKMIDVAPVATPAYRDTTVALRSLANHMGIELDEIYSLRARDELRKLFVRTDSPIKPKQMSGASARLRMLARRPNDPVGTLKTR